LASARSWREATFPVSDGYPLMYRDYPAVGAVRAEVVCVHGIQSHAGWYGHSCERIAAAGYRVFFLDRRGSGRNRHGRGDAPSFRRLLDDLAEFLRPLALANAHSLPRFLVGISWGGKLAVGLQRRHPDLVAGLVLLCPGLCAKVAPPLLQRLVIAASRMIAPRRQFPLPLNDPHLFTTTPRWLKFLQDDPLALHQATARLLIESFRLDFFARWAASAVRVPTLLLLAGQDRIIDNERTRRIAARFPGPLEVIEYPEGQHTLEFEPDPEPFIRDVIAWLNHLSAVPRSQ
jgi:alpha-beta hydrolase superfamily lysophospholipase